MELIHIQLDNDVLSKSLHPSLQVWNYVEASREWEVPFPGSCCCGLADVWETPTCLFANSLQVVRHMTVTIMEVRPSGFSVMIALGALVAILALANALLNCLAFVQSAYILDAEAVSALERDINVENLLWSIESGPDCVRNVSRGKSELYESLKLYRVREEIFVKPEGSNTHAEPDHREMCALGTKNLHFKALGFLLKWKLEQPAFDPGTRGLFRSLAEYVGASWLNQQVNLSRGSPIMARIHHVYPELEEDMLRACLNEVVYEGFKNDVLYITLAEGV